ncbi:MAG TPA: hypothetical protein VK186_14300, partial [Candidatus Deferrimicrobium sp.]|nr:hypothetical protein [Candidatus Deferrimicrobium sp.]
TLKNYRILPFPFPGLPFPDIRLPFYSSVKEAAKHGVPEMEHILKDLSFHFRKNGPAVKPGASGKANNTGRVENPGNNEQSAN